MKAAAAKVKLAMHLFPPVWRQNHGPFLLQPSQGLRHILHTPRAFTLDCAAGGAGGGTTLTALRKADEAWKRLRTAEVLPIPLPCIKGPC